jgi:hypothetical protein
MEKKSVGLLELETAVLECFLEKTPLSPLGVNWGEVAVAVHKNGSVDQTISLQIPVELELRSSNMSRIPNCKYWMFWMPDAKTLMQRDIQLFECHEYRHYNVNRA